MKRVYAFLADGFEEVECLTVVDLLRRGGVDVTTVSIMGRTEVKGAHGITVLADQVFEKTSCKDADLLFLPGGGEGTENLSAHQGLCGALKLAAEEGRRLAAICAAPSVLGRLGILEGKRATCYPGWEGNLKGAVYTEDGVVTDGLITTSRGLGYAIDLGLELLVILAGIRTSMEVRGAIQFEY
ncbi:DJ-1 family glyoxalase III [Cuneatibacter caecimuris]|uniref:4-methyl-5(B-hydroxyethyl)-thiazole monophosphate biosynthesis n=1 Tax=Cuneatibacter caecimuris TaxID=1796618 RepID=A0A4Q7PJ67_9FIRM|nr:DJ-1 family glyoxalase III [Cuneatibacter caecimuris]RZT00665.1 4-methyl-5(b-hydroxyethyl)-thiazole monophosphate biosynthesis [Cuneatibacter caecimuris]